jgi:hypothetical protein
MLPSRRYLRSGEGIVKVDGTVSGTCNLVLFNDIVMFYAANDKKEEKAKNFGLGLMAKKDKVKTDKGKGNCLTYFVYPSIYYLILFISSYFSHLICFVVNS